jgi:hypothetical protein
MGDPPDGMERGVPVEIQAKVSSVIQLFRSAGRRPERAGRPFHPFYTQALNAALLFASVAVSGCVLRAKRPLLREGGCVCGQWRPQTVHQ